MIESFLYGTWICGQVLYWFFLRPQTALLGEECWRMLNILTCRDVEIVIPASAAPCSWRS
jgi:hypothetical protein